MMITHQSKRVIPFRAHDAKRVGEGCFYLDQIVWLNGDRIELGDRVTFNFGCFVNGFGGLVFHDGANIGPYCMLHTANHNFDDPSRPVVEQGWQDVGPMHIGRNSWIGMGSVVLPGVTIGEGCVVGAGSVVTRDLDPFTIAVGNPAKAIKSRR
jgi:acetyltransferase-like isoleucine patch superfamily enzyme